MSTAVINSVERIISVSKQQLMKLLSKLIGNKEFKFIHEYFFTIAVETSRATIYI